MKVLLISGKKIFNMNIFLIAEIGINHNGNLNIAKKLIDSASEAGFDAVKFQKRTIEKVFSKDFLNSFIFCHRIGTVAVHNKSQIFNVILYKKMLNGQHQLGIWNLKNLLQILMLNLTNLPLRCWDTSH